MVGASLEPYLKGPMKWNIREPIPASYSKREPNRDGHVCVVVPFFFFPGFLFSAKFTGSVSKPWGGWRIWAT